MLYQHVRLPDRSIFSFDSFPIDVALQHLSVLAPIILSFPALEQLSSIPLPLLTRFTAALNGFELVDTEKLFYFLDNGISTGFIKIVNDFPLLSTEEEASLSSFPADRIGFNISASIFETFFQHYRHLSHRYIIRDITASNYTTIISVIRNLFKSQIAHLEIFLSFSDETISIAERASLLAIDEHLHLLESPRLKEKEIARFCPYLSPLAISLPEEEEEEDILQIFFHTLKTDRSDQLYTTVIVDENEKCLGLVYSNQQSLRQAFFEQKGIYWSRSRHQIWRKGDTSGMGQNLLEIRLDCDRDAVRMKVYQHGHPPSFCHLLTRSCWGPDRGLTKMERVLQDRKIQAPEGSYTKRLFEEEDLLRKKLLEEVQELVEAREPEHIAAEAADVLYFLMTRCVAAGVTWEAIERQLDLRSLKITRRPGHAKEWRTQEAEKILKSESTK